MDEVGDGIPSGVSWFEIPVEDVDRAVEFYSAVIGCTFTIDEDIDDTYPMFTRSDGEVYGALNLAGEYPVGEREVPVSYVPGETGVLVYLAVARDLDEALKAVDTAGGEVRVGKHPTPDGLAYSIITDTEGNRIGLIAE